MKKIFAYIIAAITLAACTNDDQYSWENDFADLTATDTVSIGIAWNGSSVTVTGDNGGYVTANGAHVTVKSSSNRFVQLTLSGATTNGSLMIHSWKKTGIVLNGVSITNPSGPAINNQCGKAFYVHTAAGTVNTLVDGTNYGVALGLTGDTIDQKGTLFSEGQIYFRGSGTLNVTGNCRNAIATDDYITFEDNAIINATTTTTGTNGIKANDGIFINGCKLTVKVASNGGRGIRCEARTVITGGTTTITTTGDCKIETIDGVKDTTSAACIKSDSLFTMTGGMLTVISTGDGGKGINCSQNIEFSGGTLVAETTGSNDEAKPKAIKSDTGIIVSGGSFKAVVAKSWACDNGNDSEEPTDHLTVKGTPTTKIITKKSVIINY